MSAYEARRATGAGIVTSEAVALDVEEATFASRFAARAADVVIVLVVLFSLQFVLGVVIGGVVFDGSLAWLAVLFGALLYVGVLMGYPMLFEALMGGRTPGKAMLGLRVVQTSGGPIRFRHAAVRALVGFGEVFLTLGVVATVAMLVDRRSRRLGDLAAGTIVVRDRVARDARSSTHAQTFTVPPQYEQLAATIDVGALDERDYGLLRAALLRLHDLPPARRDEVAAQVEATVAARVRPARPPSVPPSWWLHLLAARVQSRRAATVAARPPGPAPPRAAPPGPATSSAPDAEALPRPAPPTPPRGSVGPDAPIERDAGAEWDVPPGDGFAAPQ